MDIPSPSWHANSLFPVSLAWGLETLTVGALLDSGANECLIDVTLARQAGIPLEPMDTTLSARALDGHMLGKILHRTIPVSLTISGNHVVLHVPTAPLVLGRPWLNVYDPQVSWSTGRILGWSEACHATCLRSAPSPSSGARPRTPLLIYLASPLFITTLHSFLVKTRHSPYPLTVLMIARSISFRGPLFP